MFIFYSLLFYLSQAQPFTQVMQAAVDAYSQTSPPYSLAQEGQDWGGLCASNQSQTPIDIITAETLSVSDPSFSAIAFDIPLQVMPMMMFGIDHLFPANGTIQTVFNDTSVETSLGEVHIHIPAQHLVDGVRYAAELLQFCYQ